jgi:capsular polysaccharide biosynthesis protein
MLFIKHFMTLNTLYQRILRNKLGIFLMVLIGAVIAMFATFMLDMEYRTTSRYIVIQETRFTDAFTQAKSAEYLAGILSTVVTTDSFREAVFTGFPYTRNFFPENESELRKDWDTSIEVTPVRDTGIMSISVYSMVPADSEAVVYAVGDTLSKKVKDYLGISAPVLLVQIDGPLTSEYPVRPNFASNVFSGALIGLVVGGVIFGFKRERVRVARPARPVVLKKAYSKVPASIAISKPRAAVPTFKPVMRTAA